MFLLNLPVKGGTLDRVSAVVTSETVINYKHMKMYDYDETPSIYTNMSECLMYGINSSAWLVLNCPKL